MEVLSIIALVLLTLVGFSSGTVLAGRGRDHKLIAFDLLLVISLWVAVFFARPTLGRWWTLLMGVWVGIVTGFVMARIKMATMPQTMPKSELPEHAQAVDDGPTGFFRRVWKGWNDFSHEMGQVQGRLILSFFYFIVVAPFGLFIGLPSDFLKIGKRPSDSNWQDKDPIDLTIESAREQG